MLLEEQALGKGVGPAMCSGEAPAFQQWEGGKPSRDELLLVKKTSSTNSCK